MIYRLLSYLNRKWKVKCYGFKPLNDLQWILFSCSSVSRSVRFSSRQYDAKSNIPTQGFLLNKELLSIVLEADDFLVMCNTTKSVIYFSLLIMDLHFTHSKPSWTSRFSPNSSRFLMLFVVFCYIKFTYSKFKAHRAIFFFWTQNTRVKHVKVLW